MTGPTPPDRGSGFASQLALAMELPLVLIGSVVIAGGLGYLLDRKLHTAPWLLLIFGALGFLGGIRELLRRLSVGDEKPQSHGGSSPK